MKKEELIALGLDDEQIKQVMALKGKAFSSLETERDTLKAEKATAEQALAMAQAKKVVPVVQDVDTLAAKVAELLAGQVQAEPKASPTADAATAAASAMLEEAKQIRKRAAFDLEAIKAGISPDVLDDVAKLADLNALEIGEDGKLDNEAITGQVSGIIEKFPMLKQQTGPYAGGGNPGGGTETPDPGAYGAQIGEKVAADKPAAAEQFKDFF